MSNIQVLTPANSSITSKPSKIPSSGLRGLLYMSPLLVTLLLTGCGERKVGYDIKERTKTLENLGVKLVLKKSFSDGPETKNVRNISTANKQTMFFDKDFVFDPAIEMWLEMSDTQKVTLGLPSSDNPKIQALLSLTAEERKVLGVEKDYQEFLDLLKKSKS